MSRFFVRQLYILAMALGLWAVLIVLFATQFVLIGSFSWFDAFKQATSFWGSWVVFMPAVVWVAFRVPFETGRLVPGLCAHFVACAALVAVSQLSMRYAMSHWAPPPPEKSLPRQEVKPLAAGDAAKFAKGLLSFRAGLDILLYWSVVGICQGITSFRRAQARERRAAELEARLTRSQLQALRMQINPHFLFNTLNAISTLIYVNPRAADEMIGDLSELLRRSLDTVEDQEVTLEHEVQFIRAYIGIEQKRFGDRLRVEIEIPEELSKALVPALVLQPIVENAIRHGIEPLPAAGLVRIQATRDGNHLVLTVQDNGRGALVEIVKNADGGGIGLANTQARLRELYGQEQQFRFGESQPRGYVVEIRIPYHTVPVEVSRSQAMVPP
jgi:two-component system, LytTR family, sensor kinase